MSHSELSIEFDERDGWVTLQPARGLGERRAGSFALREGFSLDDVRRALSATAWVESGASGLLVRDDVCCRRLAGVLEEMFGYFDREKSCDRRLATVRQWLSDCELLPPGIDAAGVSDWTCAWLDVMVREDAADLARSAADVWSSQHLTVELEAIRLRRAREVVARIAEAKTASARGTRVMAASSRNRADSPAAEKRTG